jgi:hypothetical protein
MLRGSSVEKQYRRAEECRNTFILRGEDRHGRALAGQHE